MMIMLDCRRRTRKTGQAPVKESQRKLVAIVGKPWMVVRSGGRVQVERTVFSSGRLEVASLRSSVSCGGFTRRRSCTTTDGYC